MKTPDPPASISCAPPLPLIGLSYPRQNGRGLAPIVAELDYHRWLRRLR